MGDGAQLGTPRRDHECLTHPRAIAPGSSRPDAEISKLPLAFISHF